MQPQALETPMMIGMMDSGVGGLSVYRDIRIALPEVPVLYVADSAWCPYGNKPPRDIRERVLRIADHLIASGAEIIVVACNSATIHGVEPLRATYPVPFVGMEPAVKPAAERTRTGVIGVLATEASLAGEKFHRLVHTHAPGIRVITRPCPRFVDLVEAGTLDGPEVETVIRAETDPLLQEGADVLVLGCTHYPFLGAVLERVVPEGVQILDSGAAVARRVAALVGDRRGTPGSGKGLALETSGDPAHLERLVPLLLGSWPSGATLRHLDWLSGAWPP